MRKRACSRYPKRTPEQWLTLKEAAAARFSEGQSLKTIAEALNVSYEAVRVWFHKWQQGGAQAVCAQKPRGPKPRLSPEQLEQLQDALLLGPVHWGYKTQLWTLERIADLIARVFDVRYHPSHVFKLLRGMGWSCQRPTRRAKERDEAAIEQWLDGDWPRIRKARWTPEPR
ncbi:MAG: winged helix-turn-helix domain-containing protein [Armatimonadota bacterium]|nr:winged helix-turn-helix domain-containing protein [Armatimonadota bacterium]